MSALEIIIYVLLGLAVLYLCYKWFFKDQIKSKKIKKAKEETLNQKEETTKND